MKESTCWWSGWDKLPTLTSDGYEFAAKTLLTARRKESRDETWYSGWTDNVHGQYGHEAKPKHVPNILDDHNTHGWLIAALLRVMSGLSGMASFESVESRFSFNRWLTEKFVTETMRVRRFQQNSTTWEMPACMTTREVQ